MCNKRRAISSFLLSVLAVGSFMGLPVHADEKSNAKSSVLTMPPAPEGPYRSMGNTVNGPVAAQPAWSALPHAPVQQPHEPPAWVKERQVQEQQFHQQARDPRQWTPPSPPAWVQEHSTAAPQYREPPAWVKERQAQMQQFNPQALQPGQWPPRQPPVWGQRYDERRAKPNWGYPAYQSH